MTDRQIEAGIKKLDEIKKEGGNPVFYEELRTILEAMLSTGKGEE